MRMCPTSFPSETSVCSSEISGLCFLAGRSIVGEVDLGEEGGGGGSSLPDGTSSVSGRQLRVGDIRTGDELEADGEERLGEAVFGAGEPSMYDHSTRGKVNTSLGGHIVDALEDICCCGGPSFADRTGRVKGNGARTEVSPE